MLDETTSGVFTIVATPFLPDGALDLDSIDTMVDFYANTGATGITILGIMGEAGKLSAAESEAVIHRVAARTRMPVIVGVSAPGLSAIQALSATAMDNGAAGVMVAPPKTLRTDDQIISYFQLVAETLGPTPWVLQDFPLDTGVQITPRVLRTIFDTCPTCKMLKHEDWPGLEKITALRTQEAEGARRMSILCGNGGQFLFEEMQRGADGAMTGFAYPEMMRDITALTLTDPAHARDIFDAYLPLIRYECQPGMGLAVRKHILAKRGAIAHATVRKPGLVMSDTTIREIDALIERQEARLSAL
ncbi:dihydrodipicolinate synthase family protein [Rhodobacteraceae bacterium N5(2021)]|uniref:Dihydrodipicolinate synthase family protein n=1 Tax=Gymnodinialimonas phycosphaerae TaxID=2841589 RepID=A0A975TWT2_9RHOB|nr:dihydrodipicolinate synthase family protein [Gymnodinialimonas phycosphaerae]MBY4891348.1 dihydrodipicolinate synthase family protein [Gymnodinialimonas phycosphaerae]